MRTRFQLVIAVLVVLTLLGLDDRRVERVQAREDVRVSQALLTNASALNASANLGEPYALECREFAVYITWGAGTSDGAITLESATSSSYGGTWAPLTTVAWTAASKQDLVSITGLHMNIRTRISTLVAGGTVSTWITCN